MKKKILAALLILTTVFLLASCKEVSVADNTNVIAVQEEQTLRADTAKQVVIETSAVSGNIFFETEQISL